MRHLLSVRAAAILVGTLEVGGFHCSLNFLREFQEGASPRQGATVLALPLLDSSEMTKGLLGVRLGQNFIKTLRFHYHLDKPGTQAKEMRGLREQGHRAPQGNTAGGSQEAFQSCGISTVNKGCLSMQTRHSGARMRGACGGLFRTGWGFLRKMEFQALVDKAQADTKRNQDQD